MQSYPDPNAAIDREYNERFTAMQIAKASSNEAVLMAASAARASAASAADPDRRESARAAVNILTSLSRMSAEQREATLAENWKTMHPTAKRMLLDAANSDADARHRRDRTREAVRVLDGADSVALFREGDDLVDADGRIRARLTGDAAVCVRLAERAASLTSRMSGRVLMADLGPADVHPFASTMGAAMVPSVDLAADLVAPVKLVKQRGKGTWFGQSSDDAIAAVLARGAEAGGAVPEISPAFAASTYETAPHPLACYLPAELRGNADFDVLAVAAQRLAEAVALDWEVRVASLLTTAANWNAGNVVTVAAGAKWNGGASKDALGDLFAVLGASTLPVTHAVMSERTARYMFTDPILRDFVQAGGVLPRIIIAKARTKAGGSPSYVWGGDVVLARLPASETDLATARTFTWNGGTLDGADAEPVIRSAGRGWSVRIGELSDRGARGGRLLVVTRDDAPVLLDGTIGGLVKNAVQ